MLALLVFAAGGLFAQKVLKQTVVIQLPDGDGSNSAAIVWNPVTKKYYTSIAGNAIYAMGVYNAAGKPVEENVEAENDYRGMWYNTKSKRIEFNCYDSGGVGHLTLDVKGKITGKPIDFDGMNQPGDQNVGVYYPAGNNIIYLNSSTHAVEKYSAETCVENGKLITLYVGCKTKTQAGDMDADTEAASWESRNASSVQYTGIPNAELAVLNVEEKQIELYSQKSGLLTKIVAKIPESIAVYPNFNFSYTNGMWWFFNKEKRQWIGCK